MKERGTIYFKNIYRESTALEYINSMATVEVGLSATYVGKSAGHRINEPNFVLHGLVSQIVCFETSSPIRGRIESQCIPVSLEYDGGCLATHRTYVAGFFWHAHLAADLFPETLVARIYPELSAQPVAAI